MSTDQPGEGSISSVNSGLVADPGVVDSLVDVAGIGLVLVGPDETVQWVNQHAADYFSLDRGAVAGIDRAEFVDSHIRPSLRSSAAFPDGNAEAVFDCHVLPATDRTERWLQYDSVPITDGQFAGGRLEQFVDVTSDQRSERFEEFRQVVEATDDAVYVVDSDSVIEYANPAAADLTGRSVDSLVGASIVAVFERLSPADPASECFDQNLETVLGPDAAAGTVEQTIETPDCLGTFSFEREETAEGGIITVRNISDQRRRERRYEALVQNFPNGAVTLVDDELRYRLAGGQLFEDLDETPADTVGSRVGELSSGDRGVFVESYRAALDGEASTVETTVGDRTLVLRALPVYDDDGVVRTAIGMTQDITERKQREQELRWKSRALDEAPVGVTITDPERDDNPMIYANEQFIALTGYDRDSIIGNNCRFLQGPETDAEAVATLRSAIDAEEPASVELQNYRQDGSQFWNRLDIAPVRDSTGSVVNFVGFQQDITERKEHERELQELTQRLNIALGETGTGVWVLEQGDDSVTAVGKTTELFGLPPGTHSLETYLNAIVPEDRRAVEDALQTAREGDERFDMEARVEVDGTIRWIHGRGTVFEDSESHPRMVGVVTDVTERKQRVTELEKRERVLAELHTATRAFYPPRSLSDITDFLAEFTENAFDVEYACVKQFDEESGCLEPAARAVSAGGTARTIGTVAPGSNPIWESYRSGETRLYSGQAVDSIDDDMQVLSTPVGDFGVLVAVIPADSNFDTVDVDLIEVLTANAESAFQRLRTDKVHGAITDELSAQQSRITELSGIIDSVQAIQRRLAESDSQAALESGVCEELSAMDRVDFVWLAQPTGTDTDLSPAAWAGDAEGYLDAVLSDTADCTLPAQQAATDHEPFVVDNISSHVLDTSWAKEALSHEFNSVTSVPLVYDGVLYGVLSAYSRTEAAFDGIYADLLADVASMLVNYSRILEQRQGGTGQLSTELEFEIDDSTDPLQRLAAATDSTIRFDTVAERTDEQVGILVTVVDGDPAQVLEHAESMTSLVDASWFGDREHGQLSLLVRTPFLESTVSKHGGRLLAAESTSEGTTVCIEIPESVQHRPVLDSLTSRYEDIDLVAKRQTHRQAVPDSVQIGDILTDRQGEILNAAFHGGYYETPRQVTGQEIAESLGISGPAVSNHLQAAHRTLLETVFDSTPQTSD